MVHRAEGNFCRGEYHLSNAADKRHKFNLGHAICPKHYVEGKVQIKFYVEHWDRTAKSPKMCLITIDDLPEIFQKVASILRLRRELD